MLIIVIANVNINIDINNFVNCGLNPEQIKDKANQLQKDYDLLDRNIESVIYDEIKAGEKVNEIAINLKYFFNEASKHYFPKTNNQDYSKEIIMKGIIDSSLGLLKEFRKYLKNKKISERVYEIFEIDVLEMINKTRGLQKEGIIEELVIYEIFKSCGLNRNVNMPSRWDSENDNLFFKKEHLEKYHSIHYKEVLKTYAAKTYDYNPRDIYKIYFDSIVEFYKIVDEKLDIYEFLLENNSK